MRKLLQAVIILALFKYPAMQLILTLILNLSYLAFLISFQVYENRAQRRSELVNEIVIVLTIYILMLQCAFFIPEKN